MSEPGTQLTLAPEKPFVGESVELFLDQILPFSSLPPSAEFVANVGRYGVLQPPLLERVSRKGQETRYRILAGRRRVEARRQVALLNDEELNRVRITGYVVNLNGWQGGLDVLAAIENELRSENLVQTLTALEALAEEGATEAQIAETLGIPAQRQRRIWRMHDLVSELRAAVAANRMSVAAAERAARLAPDEQRALAAEAGDGRISGAMVADRRRVHRDTAVDDLFADLDAAVAMPPAEPVTVPNVVAPRFEAADWRERVLAHIRAALDELPLDAGPDDRKAAETWLQLQGCPSRSFGSWASTLSLLVAAGAGLGADSERLLVEAGFAEEQRVQAGG